MSFSSDGQLLAYIQADPTTGMDIWILRVSDPSPGSGQVRKAQPFLRTSFNESVPRFSPDGRRIAFVDSLLSGRVRHFLPPDDLVKTLSDAELVERCVLGFRKLRKIVPYLHESRERFAKPGRRVPVPGKPTWSEWVEANLGVTVRRVQQLLKEFEPREVISRGSPTPSELSAEVIASLRDDGLDFIGGKVVPAAMRAVDLKKEDEYLIAMIRAIRPPIMDEIQHHHDESEKAFANGGWGAASSEARNFLVATLRGLRESATTRGKVAPYKQPGKDGSLIEDFKTIGLFTDAEKDAVMYVWVLLSHAGPHVGIKEEDSARLSRLMAIGMTEWIALKFIGWEKNGFKSF